MSIEPNERKVLWWIIAILTTISAGAGSNYLTRLDGMAKVQAELQSLRAEVREAIDEFRHERHKP
jgi:hypothetical protein